MKLWNTPGVPHKGWECDTVYDIREDGSSPDEADYEVCQMCGNERIRYVHIMSHSDYPEPINVGCVCAEKMSDDYVGPKKKENILRNKASRRSNWLTKIWRVSSKGNDFLNINGYNIVVYPNKYEPGKWGFGIDGNFSRKIFETKDKAKIAAFNKYSDLLN
jgi:hypothetical protein